MAKKRSDEKNSKLSKREVDEELEEIKEAEKKEGIKSSKRFVSMMTLVSLTGFFGIAMKTLFERNIDIYVEVCWLFFLGMGLIWESDIIDLIGIKKTGISSDKFSKIVTLVVGVLAVITSILIIPQIGFRTPALLAIQGVISIVAIIFIVIQRFVIKISD